MADQEQTVGISAPSLPKGGGAIQSIGKGWGAVGATGSASLSIALPITAGRGYAPPLALNYQSSVGNGLFGLGWNINLGCVARRATKGVPLYNDDDVMLGPDGGVWLAQRGADGAVIERTVDSYGGLQLDAQYQVVRYFARVEGAFDRIEHWRHSGDVPGFWLVHGADGTLALYGRNPGSRSTDTEDSNRVAEWLLEETMNAHGEHILYEYKAEDLKGLNSATDPGAARNFMAQCYLWRVRYGNFKADPNLYLWEPGTLADVQWHFDLLFDYGERDDSQNKLAYTEDRLWEGRADFHSSFAYGFELGNLRFVHYVIMFHYFPDELPGEGPTLVSALKLDYNDLAQSYKVLTSAQSWSWTPDQHQHFEVRPPVVFTYQDFQVEQGTYKPFEAMPGLNDGQRYQLVDLYGEGMPGVLCQEDKSWKYRAPLRDATHDDPDAVVYESDGDDKWPTVPHMPIADSQTTVRQSLADLTGDGRLDWIVAQPGMAGFFTINPDRSVSEFKPFAAFPAEFFNPASQMADLVGAGLSDLAMIGPRSVRLYANQRSAGFAPGDDIPHEQDADRLPLMSDCRSELVAFCDILGSGQQHLVRIRHNEIRFWPNMGRGQFGKGQKFADLPFSYEEFDAKRVRLADMDGSGAVDLIYLESVCFRLFMNKSGHTLAAAVEIMWPEGLRYEQLSQVSMADLQGLGCSSLVLTVPHMKPTHWRYDHPASKPYLLSQTNNNMGASGTVFYRSSAQEWLDEKKDLRGAGLPAVSGVPFALHVVTRQTQLDEVTGNQLNQFFRYRQGYYDGYDREFRGFGLVEQQDSEVQMDEVEGFTAPVLTKTWYHTGRFPTEAPTGFNDQDKAQIVLGADLLTSYSDANDDIIASPSEDELREMARTLAGSVLRVEVFGFDPAQPYDWPYSVQTSRYLVRQLEPVGPHQPYARMLPLALETVGYQYEGQSEDPMCQRSVNLTWDAYGVLTHGVSVNYPRRKTASDPPPFQDEHQQRWWQAAHDDAQQRYYLTETKAQAIHLENEETWRLGLPYLSRVNAMVDDVSNVEAQQISHEAFIESHGWFASLPRTLVGFSKQRYMDAGEGEATFQALPDVVETAELDDHALTAYDRVMSAEALILKLEAVGYHRMTCLLPEEPDRNLWSVKRGFNVYADADEFYRIEKFRPTQSHGWSTVEYDDYNIAITAVTAPDGCRTEAQYNYFNLQPNKVVDPNQNSQEALYDGFGVVRFTSFYGTELGVEVGFGPLDDVPISDTKPASAISSPSSIDYATAYYYDAFSWLENKVPVHGVTLQWDRYPGDPERQRRIVVTSVDGFGRVLQTRQKVEPGLAFQVVDGRLSYSDGKPIEVDTEDRWRVSERVEYNNKGLAVRVYRPYFTNTFDYVDVSVPGGHWHHDKQFYDSLGRPTETWTAKGWLRRTTYRTWYTIAEDENDTAEEVNAGRVVAGLPPLDDGSSTRKKKYPFRF